MIKNFDPKPFEGGNPLPDYVSNVNRYELVGVVPGGYHVTLAKLAFVQGSIIHPVVLAADEAFCAALRNVHIAYVPEPEEVAFLQNLQVLDIRKLLKGWNAIMIISASRRTDIPALFSEWFYNSMWISEFLSGTNATWVFSSHTNPSLNPHR